MKTFANPIIPGLAPDPSICRVGADFYLATSSFEYFPGIPLHHSRDLVHWRPLGHVLTRRSQLDLAGVASSDGIYAPTIRHDGRRFHVVCTQVGGGGNFHVTADDARGPWSDPIWLDAEGFDPSLTFADGQTYYTRDGAGTDFDHPHIHQTTLDPDTGKPRQPTHVVWQGTGGVWPEAAHLYKIGALYYLIAAEGGTSYGHCEVVGRGASPFGPFEPFAGNPILTHRARPEHPIQAAGHADLVALDDGTTWAVFLGIRPRRGQQVARHHHLGRETFLAPVRWTDDGWPIIGHAGAIELEMAAPALAPQPFPAEPARDDFDAPAPGPAWSFVRNPDARDFSLTERPGFLRLHGAAATLDDVASPALLLRRQQHFVATCRAALDFAPRAPHEEAGLAVRANESFHYRVVIRRAPAGREAALVSRVAGVTRQVLQAPIADGPVELRVSADDGAYTFAAEAGGRAHVLGALPVEALSAERIAAAGQKYFTGVTIGPYASGNGRRASVPADFDWFEYAPGGA